ncbi:MAG: SurA N-terminal domain-containing protein, partial [Planctomycetales bacterium]|nr:SurA N-terminal domain-containing protein [Planctomycetales bacterium]
MTSLRKFTIRLAVYGIALVYLALDLFVFHGPLAKRIERVGTRPDDGNVVARVFNHHITLDQLDRAVRERLWLEGRDAGELSADELKLIRYVALDGLIDHELLRVKAKANAPDLIVSEEEVDERLRRLAARFES